jgi:hypothetical protein
VVLFPQKLVKKLNRARVDFGEPELRRFIEQHGLSLKWEAASRCPCVRQVDGQAASYKVDTFEPRTDCSECNGSGVIYFNPQLVTAFLLSANQDEGLRRMYGERSAGMVRVTVNHEHKPSIGDRYTAQQSTYATDEIRTRTAATIEALRYPIAIRNYVVGSDADPTEPEERQLGVVYCRRADANGVLVGNVLVEDTDFTITADGEIDWTLGDGLGTAPVEDARFAVKYYSHPVYVVENIPYQHRDQNVKVRDPEDEKSPDLQFKQLPIHAHCWFEQFGSTGLAVP